MEGKTILLIAGGLAAYLVVGYINALRIRNSARGISSALQIPMQHEKLNKVIIFLWPFKMIGII